MIPRSRMIRLGWHRSAVARATTIASGRPKIDGMINTAPAETSPYDQERDRRSAQVREHDKMRHDFLASIPPSWRTPIFSINLMSASCCGIELKSPIDEATALGIGRAAEQAFGREVILNGWWTLEDVANGLGGPWSPSAQAWFAAQMRGK